MMLALDVNEAIVGIEENKRDAIDILKAASKDIDGLYVKALPVRYPHLLGPSG